MKVSIKKLKESKVNIQINVPIKEKQKYEEKVIKKLANKVQIKGFRKGHAPKSAIVSKFGQEAINAEINDSIIQEYYPKAVVEKKIEVVGQPKLEKLDETKDEIKFEIIAPVMPEFDMPDYKKVKIQIEEAKITKKAIDDEIKNSLASFATTVSKKTAAKESDIVNIDFEGSVDGKVFEGGSAKDYNLTIGSNTFIPGFEDQLIGLKKGDKKDIKVTFPKDYQVKELQNKESIFKIKVNDVKEKKIPKLTDEFVSQMGRKGIKTSSEFKKDIENKLIERKKQENKSLAVTKALDTLRKEAKIEISKEQIDAEVKNKIKEMESQVAAQGLNLDQYLSMTNSTKDDLIKNLTENSKQNIANSLILNEIIKKEKISVSQKDVDKELENMSKKYGMSVDEIKKTLNNNLEQLKYDLKMKKAIELLVK